MPAVPAPPAGATTIVLNWHWACADAPPPLEIEGMTVCTSCNIAISVRVGSPGDAGDVAQSIDAATDVAGTIQAALQTATPLSAPPTPSPMPDIAAAVVAPLVAAAQALTYRI